MNTVGLEQLLALLLCVAVIAGTIGYEGGLRDRRKNRRHQRLVERMTRERDPW